MSGENKDVRELVELLTKEKTLTGQYFGHRGQANVAEREYLYAEQMLTEKGEKLSLTERKYYERWRDKAKARMEYHKKMAEEVRKELCDVRKRIREIIGGDVE
ncbi:MAG: hypothetical protein OBKJMPBA_00012 [Methanophagales virus PBV304]|uniref:Uncharacterized protein n=1 Tax=Methanophagales virus PBV304 TaxID=3071309 RepID=A0AA46TDJ7_9VIRU|nr:MAG: hypothetical protein QIT47_gp12 [Methanophagales virus PBV304]UYL65044.1 MAG: hypothetical protein OBKJMPBA_00012 [Methanophagales virus PBV304]